MAVLMKNNIILDDVVNSITHTASLGSITPNNSINLIEERSITKQYQFSFTAIGIKTLNINFKSSQSFSCFAIMGLHSGVTLQSVRAYNGASLIAEVDRSVEYLRFIDGKTLQGFAGTFPWTVLNCDRLEIWYSDVDIGDGHISCLYVGHYSEFNIKPILNTEYFPVSNKERTLGGQIKGSAIGSHRAIRFESTKLTHDFVEQQLADINYASVDVLPLIFIPSFDLDYFLYGPQKKLWSEKNILRKENGKWNKVVSFLIEEEF